MAIEITVGLTILNIKLFALHKNGVKQIPSLINILSTPTPLSPSVRISILLVSVCVHGR